MKWKFWQCPQLQIPQANHQINRSCKPILQLRGNVIKLQFHWILTPWFCHVQERQLGRFYVHNVKLQCRPNHRHLWLLPNSIQFEHVMNVRSFLRYILTDLVIKHDFDLLDEKEARLDFFLTTNIFRESLPSCISINNAKKYPKCPSQTKRII